MDYPWNYDERELVIRTMGNIQLEILAYLLQERYGMAVQFSPPSVIYKETVTHKGTGHESYTMPKPCWALVTLDVEPLPRGSGFRYKSATHQSVLQERYQNHVKIAVADAVEQGRLGWEVTDAQFTLADGGSHIYHTHPMDFFLATPIAVMRALESAGPTLLEPLVKLRLTAAEELSGKLIGDIVKMRGEFDSPVITGGKLEMEAIVPVATSMDYAIRFSSLTSGRGIMKSDFYGYVECPLEMGATSKRRGIDPLDRDKWILYKRGALSS
jgi:ribosomal protection tetracycline resistance protein